MMKKRVFAIFIVLHVVFWTFLQLLRETISIDAMEAISWGNLLSFGTNKHPPLSGWLLSGFYNLYGQFDILVYILGQLCLLVGFIYIYKYILNWIRFGFKIYRLNSTRHYIHNFFIFF